MGTFNRLGQSELLPRYIFAESLFARRRVLEIGAVASTLGQSARFLSTRGARTVVAADADLAAVHEAQSRLSGPTLRFRPPIFDDFEGGSFDLVIVADLSSYVYAPELLKELARLVAKNGYLMGGLRNAAGLALSNISDPEEGDAPPSYGQLLDALTSHFNSIEVATQSPVLGYQIAFERGEGLQVDGSLAGHSEAAYYVVLAGHEPVRNFDPTWVQLPPEPLAFTGGKLEDASRRATEWRDRSTRLKEVLATKTNELTSREGELRETMQQLESAKEGVSRLTAQLETAREAPESLRERDDLANRIRRVEAELTVARDRATDAEGRATGARNELEAFRRAQKDAAMQTLAMQEQMRLERARREEVATQLEDSRNRLASAYTGLRRAEDQLGAERIEHEKTRAFTSRLTETIASKEADLAAAGQRELTLSDARTQALLAIEGLERSLGLAREQLAELREDSNHRDAERISLERSLEVERSTRAGLKAEVEREAARAKSLQDELSQRQAELTALDTELQSARSAHARSQRDIETLSSSERTWREIAQQTGQQLADTTANVQALSDQLAQAEAEKESATARARRLESDLTTVIGSERALREQAEATIADLTTKLREASDDRDTLISERDDLRGSLNDVQKARASDQTTLAEMEASRAALDLRVTGLELRLGDARRQHAEAQHLWEAKEQMLEARLAEHVKSLAAETSSVSSAREQLAALEQTLSATQASLNEARGATGDVERRFGEQAKELEATRAEGITAREALRQSQNATEALEARLAKAVEEALRVRNELVSTRDEFTAREKKLSESRGLVELEKTMLERRYKDLDTTAQLTVARTIELEERVTELSKALRTEEEERAEELRQHDDNAEWMRGELALERQTAAQLKASLEAAVGSARTLTRELQGLRSANAEVAAARDASTARVGALEAEAASNQARISELTGQMAALERASQGADEEIGVTRGNVARLEEAHAELQGELERLRREAAEQQRRFEAAQGDLQAAQGLFSESSAHLDSARAEVARLTTEVADAAAARSVERERLTQQREAEVAALAASLAEFQSAKQAVETQAGSLQEQLSSAQSLLATSKNHGAELEEKLDTLTQELASTAARAARIDTALEASKREHDGLVAALRRELDSTTQTFTKKSSELEGLLQKNRLEAEHALIEREERIAGLESGGSEKTQQIEAIRTELAALQTGSEHRAAELNQERERLQTGLAETKDALARAQSEARGHQLGKQHNQSELDKAREALSVTKAALTAAGGEQQSARAALELSSKQTETKLEATENERTQLAAKVEALETALGESLSRAEADHALLAAQIIALQDSLAQANADVLEATKPTGTEDATPLRSRIEVLEGELAAAQSVGHTQANQREQAEELLIVLRGKYGDLQFELERTVDTLAEVKRDSGKTASLQEQVVELQSENILLEQERERLASRIEELEGLNRDRVKVESRVALGAGFEVPTRPYAMKDLQAQTAPTNPNAHMPLTGELELLDTSDGVPMADDAEEILLLDEEVTDPNRKKPR